MNHYYSDIKALSPKNSSAPQQRNYKFSKIECALKFLRSILAKGMVWLLRIYQVAHLPFWRGSCRFFPTCSQYAIEAIQQHGPLRGCGIAARRLCRCHPFSAGGYDPVPSTPSPSPVRSC